MHMFDSKLVKTRKNYNCFGCERHYRKVAYLWLRAVADEGTIYSYYLCKVCKEVTRSYHHDDYYSQGDIKNGDPEFWESVRKSIQR